MKKEEIQKIKFYNWPLPEDILTELGRMHSLWNGLENSLQVFIGKLSGFNNPNDMRFLILLNHTSFQQKIDILSSLCDYLKEEFPLLSKYPEVISSLKVAQKGRNTYTHQNVVFNPDSQELELASTSVREKLKTDVKNIGIDDIKRTIIDINEASSALYELIVNKKIKRAWKKFMDGEKV